jgi:hypothetical protein
MNLPDTKPVLSLLWNDKLTVTEYQKVKDLNDGSTGFEEVQTLTDEPCKLSYSTLNTVNQTDVAALVQVTKVFLDCDVEIKAGSKLTIQHKGRTLEFSQSGLPGIFSSHQEIVIVPFSGWA